MSSLKFVQALSPEAIPSNGMSREAMASRRVTIIEAIGRLQARGWELPSYALMAPAGNTRTAKAWTPAELKQTREKRVQASRVRTEAKPKAIHILKLEPGTWIEFIGKDKRARVAQVLSVIRPSQDPKEVIPEGATVWQTPNPGPARIPRYLLALPGTATIRPRLRLAITMHLEASLVRVLDEAPDSARLGRMPNPLAPGENIRWDGARGFRYAGVIKAFVPAGVRVETLSSDWTPRSDGEGPTSLSIRDRYLIRSGGRYLLPLAYVVERAYMAAVATL